MKNRIDELKSLLRERLAGYPFLLEFYGEMLENQMKQEKWLENDFVYLLLRPITQNLKIMSEVIERIGSHDQKLLFEIRHGHSLSGKEFDFNSKLGDLFAELNGADWLIDNRYESIRKIPNSSTKSPDFSSEKDSNFYLTEVKNLRAPTEYRELLQRKLFTRSLLYPEDFNLLFFIERKGGISASDIASLNMSVDDIIVEVHQAVKNSKREVHVCGYHFSWSVHDHFSSLAGLGGVSSSFSSKSEEKEYLQKLQVKTDRILEHAQEQLLMFRDAEQYDKSVLLNWQKPIGYIVNEDAQKAYARWIVNVNDQFKKKHDMSVILMGY